MDGEIDVSSKLYSLLVKTEAQEICEREDPITTEANIPLLKCEIKQEICEDTIQSRRVGSECEDTIQSTKVGSECEEITNDFDNSKSAMKKIEDEDEKTKNGSDEKTPESCFCRSMLPKGCGEVFLRSNDSSVVKIKGLECSMCYQRNRANPSQKEETFMKCHSCSYSTTMQSSLRRHIDRVHANVKRNCLLCDFSTFQENALKSHIDKVHAERGYFSCHLCDYRSYHLPNLRSHVTRVHLSVKHYRCDFCDFSTTERGTLRGHINTIHLKKTNYKCDLCNYNSHKLSLIRQHFNVVHLNIKKYNCEYCDFRTNSTFHLKQHLHKIHQKIM